VHEADHFPLSAAEVRNNWSYTFTLPICLHNIHRDNFTFSRPVTLLMLSKVQLFSVMKIQVHGMAMQNSKW